MLNVIVILGYFYLQISTVWMKHLGSGIWVRQGIRKLKRLDLSERSLAFCLPVGYCIKFISIILGSNVKVKDHNSIDLNTGVIFAIIDSS